MPTANIFWNQKSLEEKWVFKPEFIVEFKKKLAEILSCNDRDLDPKEVSIRIINTYTEGMISEMECDISAYSYPERIQKQDEICNEVKEWIKKNLPETQNVSVWLSLSELWHSF